MVYILTITTIYNWGAVEHEIQGVYLTMDRIEEEIALLQNDDRISEEKHEIEGRKKTYKRHYNIIKEYLRG